MPIHIEEITSDVSATAGDLPLSQSQIDQLVALVMKRIEAKQRESKSQEAGTRVRPSAAPGENMDRQ